MLQERLVFDEIEAKLRRCSKEYKDSIHLLEKQLEKLRDAYHEEKSEIKKNRQDKFFSDITLKNKRKPVMISTLVLRIKKIKVTEKKSLKSFDSGIYYQLLFYRSSGSRRYDHIHRRQDKTFSYKSLCTDLRHKVTDDEKEMLKFYVDEVNVFNQKILALKNVYVHSLEALNAVGGMF